ncbi:MAG: sulfatase/phosphatase domain-containing protein [Verrucomicrobiota bacterium]
MGSKDLLSSSARSIPFPQCRPLPCSRRGHGVPIHFGVTDGRYKLLRFPEAEMDDWELFDIQADPLELESRYNDPTLEEIQNGLREELVRLRIKYDLPEGELD